MDEDDFWYHSPDVHGNIQDLLGVTTRKIKIGFIDFEKEKSQSNKRKPKQRTKKIKGD